MSESMASRILTVEDSDNIRRMIAYNLERAGYEVFQAAHGKDAVRILQKVVPDLIILDVRMPEMNGFQLLELMRKYPKAAAIPVIMLSALSQPENIDRALSLGVVDYIVKPLDPTVLLAKVKEALSHSKNSDGGWLGPNRRQFERVTLDGVELKPQPGGRGVDLSEGGLSWRTKSPPAENDVLVIEAHELFELVGIDEQTLRARVAYVKPVGLGYFRVGAAFIGLPSNGRDAVRRYVKRHLA
ncbi:MAG: response regulator [Bradymonadia bacterium]